MPTPIRLLVMRAEVLLGPPLTTLPPGRSNTAVPKLEVARMVPKFVTVPAPSTATPLVYPLIFATVLALLPLVRVASPTARTPAPAVVPVLVIVPKFVSTPVPCASKRTPYWPPLISALVDVPLVTVPPERSRMP